MSPSETTPARLRRDLTGGEARLIETHISWVLVGRDEVIKIKRPVDLGFLDFSTPELRRRASQAEVRLNRRLAPEVYLGVEPVTRDDRGRWRLGGEGPALDWAVRMRRLPDAERADVRLAEGRLDPTHLDAVARRLADFHATARCDAETTRHGTAAAVAANVRENFEQTRETIGAYLAPEEARELRERQEAFLRRHGELFTRRIADGRVRDGHGDLRLEHVYLRDSGNGGADVTIIDCIEFNRRFRFADVAADVAFLSMDLAFHGRVDLAEAFLAAYARETGDYNLYRLVDFYESYRAFVRAKVASMVAADGELSAATREAARETARRYYLLALAAERRPLLPPVVVAVGGVIAAGKSTVARGLSAAMGAPVVDADRTRKALLGVEPTRPLREEAFAGAYRPEVTEKVYAELVHRAGAVLTSGRPVILDASFRARSLRQAARRLAREKGLPFLFVECRASPELCRQRLAAREAGVSDGRLEIFQDFLARWEETEELAPEEHRVVDTARPLAETLAELRQALPTWPPDLTA